MKRKQLMAAAAILILLVPTVLYLATDTSDTRAREEAPSQEWVNFLVNGIDVERNVPEELVYTGFVDPDTVEDDIIHLAATPLLFNGDSYSPLIISSGGQGPSAERFIALCGREARALPSGGPVEATINISTIGWKSSDAVIAVNDPLDALAVAPLAALLDVPILFANGSATAATKDEVSRLDVGYCIAVGSSPALGTRTMRLPSDSISDFYLWCLAEDGIGSDYIIVTNPRDMYAYSWGKGDQLPIPYLSLLSAQLGAARRAPIFYTEGITNMSDERGSPENVQLGVPAEYVNMLAEHTREVVRSARELAIGRTGANDTMYLALVGGPAALPFHYHYEPSSEGETTFSNTDYIASDYYFGDLDEDYTMELAVGRIIGRDIEDASVLLARTLLDGAKYFEYENDGDISQDLYDTVSDSWLENSALYIGTTRTGPLPGCLKHAKSYQLNTMSSGGFNPTPLEGYKANTQTVSETVDKVQYCVYYGHGNPYCWWSNREDYITADTVSSSNLKAGLAIAMACMTARVDNSTDALSELISLAFLNGGYNCYIGATRLAYGLVELYDDPDTSTYLPVDDTDALYLVDRFTYYICIEDQDVGMALMNARNDLTERFNIDGGMGARVAMWEYVLYGDPAYNMHVPALD